MSQWLALSISIVVEALVAASLVAGLRWGTASRAALSATLGTLVTHGFAWNGMLILMESLDYWIALLCVETAVVLVESLAYVLCARLSLGRALFASLIANGASSGFGLALYGFGLA